jgi:hypothetical protein
MNLLLPFTQQVLPNLKTMLVLNKIYKKYKDIMQRVNNYLFIVFGKYQSKIQLNKIT